MEWSEFTTADYPVLLEGNLGCCVTERWGVYVKLLLDSLQWEMEQYPEMMGLRVKQIKEKFGGLRIYCDITTLSELDTARVQSKIEMVELICSHTCIECGSHVDVINTVKDGGCWLSPRCPDHR